MSMLQVRNLPEDLHQALAERARAEGMTMSEFVTRLLRRELSRPSLQDWIADRRGGLTMPIDVVRALDDVRAEYDPDERVTPPWAEEPAATPPP
ncbi:FitA-like ribbon-helix-helix domain-containing protein [Occultella kanbiaonis]|uniref:FitA-like ribbon-helix-helix domain-containing protein n=1 Tax=Occultella kanbiaonis TaxID=2675754 RepID=UPI0012BA0BCA|nr:hypothetical protein [Occultella kanbiaonis]